jgi:hypothetical protein
MFFNFKKPILIINLFNFVILLPKSYFRRKIFILSKNSAFISFKNTFYDFKKYILFDDLFFEIF